MSDRDLHNISRLSLFPFTSEVNDRGHLCIGGCDVVDLVREYGTPLYLFDEFTIRYNCREFRSEFGKYYSNTMIIYASKAFLNRALARIMHQEQMGLDVVSGGELSIAHSVGFPLDKVYFHGNNKTLGELNLALDWGVGRIVVDNFYELELLSELAQSKGLEQDILLRLTPGVDPHAHRYTTTGALDSKFGFPMIEGQAEQAVKQAISASNLNLLGFHFHLGSPIVEMNPYEGAIEMVLNFAHRMKTNYRLEIAEFSPGGGFAVRYTVGADEPSIRDYAQAITGKLLSLLPEMDLGVPRLIIEPGRRIIAQAGVALYHVGATKEIPGVKKYVFVDGGMSDNIRPALYEAEYEAVVANKILDEGVGQFTIAGKLCESGDILVRDTKLPAVSTGDLIAMPACGAYCVAMSSNYNALPRPAIVMVNQGEAHLIRRRENYQDLMGLDID